MAQGDIYDRVRMLPAIRDMPSTVALIPDGSAQIGEDISAGLLAVLISGVLCIYCVLVLLFQDFFQPIIILSALPLSVGGAFLALFMTGSALVPTAMIGLVMLMGIVAKKFHPVGGICNSGHQGPWRVTGGRAVGGLPDARTTNHHDKCGDDSGHGAPGVGYRRRRQLPTAYGSRRHRWLVGFNPTKTAGRTCHL